MINLLPDTDKKEIHKEYLFRLGTLWVMSILILILLTAVLLVPSYILALYKGNSAEQAATITPAPSKDQDTKAFTDKLQTAKLIQEMLKPDTTQIVPSALIATVIQNKTSDNTVTSISYTKSGQDPFTLVVRGIAKSRKSLSAFQHSLQTEEGIGMVNVPLSDFTKDSNIDYAMDIHGK